ncbi:lysine N(6)-hydroxylase/L-ornithine N(5)-oxygenase family protein [Streptomyces sp. NPDC057702]|uniref:lysine N(6)-hydroxylase/L-ornithine N(5)-oxygenase family protein n=1 Tax=unclassified Streptomyces TaxID=2593676 RepID=UPI00368A674C
MNHVSRDTETIYDLLGIGFGPSNLALAIAIEEHNTHARTQDRIRARFLEKQATFGWHRGMLIDDATMQVSFPKDLVTMRDPTSDYSFLYYLKEQGRLVDFLNQKTLFPLRIEFHDYFEWAAGRLAHLVDYAAEVVAVTPVTIDGEVRYFDVTSRAGGSLHVRRTRDICVATGMRHRLPEGAPSSERVLHNRDLVPRVAELAGAPLRRVVVLGAGQSAAETVGYLHRAFPEAEVCAVFAKYGYTPADDSPFANRIFDPEAVDAYYQAPNEVKESLLGYHRSTNYSAVDIELIESLYRTQYQERVQGKERLRMLNVSRLRAVESDTDGLRVTVEFLPTGEQQVLEADLLVYATGYLPPDPGTLLGEAGALCHRDEEGALRVDRDHRVAVADHVRAGIYLQGSTEHTHGITSTLLSHTAVRVGEILDSVLSRQHKPEPSKPRV